MKSTGIVRRIDDLGRIIIPKDIRRVFHITEGDPMEIFVDEDSVILKRYYPQSTVLDALSRLKGIVVEEFDLPCRTELLQTIYEMQTRLELELQQKSAMPGNPDTAQE